MTQTTTAPGKTIETVLHYYRFDISNPAEAEQYKALCASLKAQGLKVFDSIAQNHSKFYKEQIQPLNGQPVQLETEHLFNNQWNTTPIEGSKNGLRVFDWSEPIYPNRKIKEGMYLDQTPEMVSIRKETYKCNYCGKNYHKPEQAFCTACLGSEFLTPDNFPLLALTPICKEYRDKKEPVIIPEAIIKEYNERQKESRTARLKKQQDNKLASIQADIESSKIEYDAFKWLIDRDMNFDNVIYYSHSKEFCFGWRNSLSDLDKAELKTALESFPYPYKLK
mgnify:CR=1 FL=1